MHESALDNFPSSLEQMVPVSVLNERDKKITALTEKNKSLETRLEMYRTACLCQSIKTNPSALFFADKEAADRAINEVIEKANVYFAEQGLRPESALSQAFCEVFGLTNKVNGVETKMVCCLYIHDPADSPNGVFKSFTRPIQKWEPESLVSANLQL